MRMLHCMALLPYDNNRIIYSCSELLLSLLVSTSIIFISDFYEEKDYTSNDSSYAMQLERINMFSYLDSQLIKCIDLQQHIAVLIGNQSDQYLCT